MIVNFFRRVFALFGIVSILAIVFGVYLLTLPVRVYRAFCPPPSDPKLRLLK